MEYAACKSEIGGGLAGNACHKVVFGFFDHTGALFSEDESGSLLMKAPRSKLRGIKRKWTLNSQR
jgi:hypothetical protein